MPEPELHVRKITKTVPACESGRHVVHPFYECDEVDVAAAALAELYQQAVAEAYAEGGREFDRRWITGNGTGDMRGLLPVVDLPDPTSAERAFTILEPHLREVPLFRPKFACGGYLPKDFGATADRPPALYPHTRKERS